jgi:hypothetical protein
MGQALRRLRALGDEVEDRDAGVDGPVDHLLGPVEDRHDRDAVVGLGDGGLHGRHHALGREIVTHDDVVHRHVLRLEVLLGGERAVADREPERIVLERQEREPEGLLRNFRGRLDVTALGQVASGGNSHREEQGESKHEAFQGHSVSPAAMELWRSHRVQE